MLLVSMIARKLLARTRTISLSLAKTKFNTFKRIQSLYLVKALTTLL